MKLLVVVPARGGSKGLPRKNIQLVGGVPLVGSAARLGRAALRVTGIDGRVLIDTDDPEIAAAGCTWGGEAPFLRETALAGDTVSTFASVDAAIDRMAAEAGFVADTILLLQPTSPLRSLEDIRACLDAYDPAGGSVVAVTPTDHPAEQTMRLGDRSILAWAFPDREPDRRRQDLPAGFRPTGAVYVISVAALRAHRTFVIPGQTRAVTMPRERSVDVDDRADLELARALFRMRGRRPPPWPAGTLRGFATAGESGGLLADAGTPLPALLDLVDERRAPFVLAPSIEAFLELDEALPVGLALVSTSLAEHAVAVARGAVAFVAPAALHAEIQGLAASAWAGPVLGPPV